MSFQVHLGDGRFASFARTAKQLQPLESMVRKQPNGTLGFVASGLCAADVLPPGCTWGWSFKGCLDHPGPLEKRRIDRSV